MAFVALLDANVLYPAYLRDALLRLAEAETYELRHRKPPMVACSCLLSARHARRIRCDVFRSSDPPSRICLPNARLRD